MRRRHRREHTSKMTEAAREAGERAERDLQSIRRAAPRIERITRYLQREGTRNHWSERMLELFRGAR